MRFHDRSMFSRREFLWRLGGGLGGIALVQLLAEQALLADAAQAAEPTSSAALNGGLGLCNQTRRARKLKWPQGAPRPPTLGATRENRISGLTTPYDDGFSAGYLALVRPLPADLPLLAFRTREAHAMRHRRARWSGQCAQS